MIIVSERFDLVKALVIQSEFPPNKSSLIEGFYKQLIKLNLRQTFKNKEIESA